MNQFSALGQLSGQKVPFLCFACRMGIKRALPFYVEELGARPRLDWAKIVCPRCKAQMVYMGRYFKIPPQSALDQWRKVELLWRSGWMANDTNGRGPETLREARDFVAPPSLNAQCQASQRQREREERWRRLRLQREYLRRHKAD